MKSLQLSAEEEAFLTANPWCATKYNAPDTVRFTPGFLMTTPTPRLPKPKDWLFSRVLRDSATVPLVLGFHPKSVIPTISPGKAQPKQDKFLVTSASLIFDLRDGTRGFNGYTHGGFFGCLIDESCGNYLFQAAAAMVDAQSQIAGNSEADREKFARDAGLVDWDKRWAMTVGINIRFSKPIDPPAVVIARSFLDRIEGRKMWIKTVLEGEGGAVYSTAESIWLLMQGERGKL